MDQKSLDRLMMKRALDLARLGFGKTRSNPMVGCVIAVGNQIIGEGYHTAYGQPHAEVEAFQSVKKPELISKATVYVTLEPCNHFGKTPPCADLVCEKNPARIVVAMQDPHKKVAGKGLQTIRKAGIAVEVGLLEQQSTALNPAFIHWHTHHKTYVLLKWAETQDGFIARENFDSKWISDPFSRLLVHKSRAGLESIAVGFRTAKYDQPNLINRDWPGSHPTRILFDKKGNIPTKNLLTGDHPTFVFTTNKNLSEAIYLPDFHPDTIIQKTTELNLQSILIEGGSSTVQSFIDQDLWNEAWVFKSKNSFGKGITAPKITAIPKRVEQLVEDKLLIYRN
jgi:diaminohydroxyphosphoribosylaminopyrimidine deaminase/5-amino-6-(5-phosphoribosylamino)uracil reductase